jgi:hypothetical protein
MLLDRCHVYAFKPQPHDRQRSKNEVTRADKWPDAPSELIERAPGVWSTRACAAEPPDRTRQLTHQTHHNVAFGRVQRATWEGFCRSDASDHNWPDAPQRPFILARFAAPLGADVILTGHAGARPASARGMNWPDATLAFGRLDHGVWSLRK